MPRKPKHTADENYDPSEPRPLPDRDSDEWVEVFPEAGLVGSTARVLLDAATAIGYDEQRAVLSISGGFRVPQDVLDEANLPDEPLPAAETAPTPLAALDQGATPDPAPVVDDAPVPDAQP